ncbi:hypothetical protein [Chondromyces apiculatus]|nr:hypothetical protein [Chondromyces apiculatus]
MSVSSYLVRVVLGAWRAQEMRGEDWGAGLEAMGTKKKFWCQADDGRRYLFKYTRPGTGEDWSEKVAAAFGAALQVTCATVELATYEDHRGTLTQSFTDAERGEVLVHGNELLGRNDLEYLPLVHYGASQHTVDTVLRVLDEASVDPPLHREAVAGLTTAANWFLGYLLLDVLIGNTDRHHENWGIVEHDGPDGTYRSRQLFPFFSNRVMPASRPEFTAYVRSLGLDPMAADSVEILEAQRRRSRLTSSTTKTAREVSAGAAPVPVRDSQAGP